MGVAIQNARLFEAEQERVAELAIVNSVQEGLSSKLDIQAIYDLVGDKIRDIFDAQGVSITHYDRAANFIAFPYYLFRGKSTAEEGVKLGSGLTSHVIQSGQPLVINENAMERYREFDSVPASDETEENTAKSWLGVPLISGGQTTGTIHIENYEREYAFSDSDVRLLQTLANAMSVALENARLFDETQHPVASLEPVDVVTGWFDAGIVEGGKNKLVPSVSLKLRNKAGEPVRSIQINAIFRRVGEAELWGEHFGWAVPREGLAPGETTKEMVLQYALGYTSETPRLLMLQNSQFVDAKVELFLKQGSQVWAKLAEYPIQRQLLTR